MHGTRALDSHKSKNDELVKTKDLSQVNMCCEELMADDDEVHAV